MIVLAGDIGGTNSRFALYEVAPRAVGAPKPDGKPILRAQIPFGVAHLAGRRGGRIPDGRLDGARRPRGPGQGHPFGLLRGRRPRREQHLSGHQPSLGRRRAVAGRAPGDGTGRLQRLSRRRARRDRGRRRVAGAAGRPALHARPIVVLAPGPGSGSCSGPRTTRIRWSRPRRGTWTSRPARRSSWVLQFLTNKYGRVSCERVLSGRGLVDVFSFLSQEPGCDALIPSRDSGCACRARPGPGSRRRDLRTRALGGRSHLRDVAGGVLFRAGGGGRESWPCGALHRRRVPGWGHRPPHAALPAQGSVPQGVRAQGPPAHAARAHAGLRGDPPPHRPHRRRRVRRSL